MASQDSRCIILSRLKLSSLDSRLQTRINCEVSVSCGRSLPVSPVVRGGRPVTDGVPPLLGHFPRRAERLYRCLDPPPQSKDGVGLSDFLHGPVGLHPLKPNFSSFFLFSRCSLSQHSYLVGCRERSFYFDWVTGRFYPGNPTRRVKI